MNIDAFILIGGKSSRFGADKAFVEFDDELLSSRIARVVREAISSEHITFIAAHSDQFDAESTHRLDNPVIFDLKPGFGAWSGLHTALSNERNEWVFLSACDHPMMSSELLRLMAGQITDANDAIVPRQPDGRLQPLCAFYRVNSALNVVNQFLEVDSHLPPLTAIFEKLKTHIIEPHEYADLENSDKFFLNINTPADLVWNQS